MGERLPDLLDEGFGDRRGVVLVPQRSDEVPDARPSLPAFLVPHLAHGLHPADLDPLDVVRDDDLLFLAGCPDLVVPDFHLDAAIERAALFGVVRGDRLLVADPLVGDRLGRQPEHLLEILGHLAGALARQAHVVPELLRQRSGEPLRVRVADEVDADVPAVPHAFENPGEPLDVVGRNLHHAGFEADRRDDVPQLDGFELLRDHLPGLQPIAPLAFVQRLLLRPLTEGLVGGQVPLDRLARLVLVGLGVAPEGAHREPDEQEREEQRRNAARLHAVHLPPGARTPACLGGPPRRQKISGSMVSG